MASESKETKETLTSQHLEDMLPLYYKKLFPSVLFMKWLAYGDIKYLVRREFSFTLVNDIYIRYLTFDASECFAEELYTSKPIKIDIGAVYNMPTRSQQKVAGKLLIPKEKELVFDIDLTDYDGLRTCCSEANVCNKCWKFMKIATKILDAALREDFGMKDILWVFSGRRGIHCWVADPQARQYPDHVRHGIVDFMNLIKGGVNQPKKVTLWGNKIHYSIQRAIDIIKPYFKEILVEQNILGTDERLREFFQLIDVDSREKYEKAMTAVEGSVERWEAFVEVHKNLVKLGNAKKQINLVEEIMLQYTYPRLDINVSHSINHLLKAPFCVHPKTGKICIPFNPKSVDKFDVDAVPTLSLLLQEIGEYDTQTMKQEKEDGMEDNPDDKSKLAEIFTMANYKKTSLLKPIRIFEQFLREIELHQNIKL